MQGILKFAMIFVFSCLIRSGPASVAGQAAEPSRYVPDSILSERLFPLLHAVSAQPEIARVLLQDPELRRMMQNRASTLTTVETRCGPDRDCICDSLVFGESELAESTATVQRLYETSPVLQSFARQTLVPTARYALNPSDPSAKMFAAAWQHELTSINAVNATYCSGKLPRYPRIDSPSYGENSAYTSLLQITLDDITSEASLTKRTGTSFDPSLQFAVRLLQANGRDEAGRLWPLDSGENKAALKRRKLISWSRYPYSAILIPGAGPELASVPISPLGKERVRLGVEAYQAHKAPYLLVSGGFVHPSQTPYCEALEMKRYLMQAFGVPEADILIDPYARHTTTNLRNASREILDYALPVDRPMMIVSDTLQTAYMQSEAFQERSLRELGYQPVRLQKQLSSTTIEAFPAPASLLQDATDPLDP